MNRKVSFSGSYSGRDLHTTNVCVVAEHENGAGLVLNFKPEDTRQEISNKFKMLANVLSDPVHNSPKIDPERTSEDSNAASKAQPSVPSDRGVPVHVGKETEVPRVHGDSGGAVRPADVLDKLLAMNVSQTVDALNSVGLKRAAEWLRDADTYEMRLREGILLLADIHRMLKRAGY